ncbi:MAG: hypothetical protein IKO00_02960 [Oscillospiraceae bacterium]|nr:hypothetical protein [Oscillospiraceae bacterium]
MRDLGIAYGASRQALKWSNKTISFENLKERLKHTLRTPESAEEYAKMSKADRDQAKDHGGFVAGVLIGGRRKVDTVESRSMISLDGDRIDVAFLDGFEENMPYTAALYTTHSSTEEKPRVRIIIPMTRDTSPEEFAAVSRYLAQMLGIDYFDECSYLPNQLMYWPSTPANGSFVYKETEGPWLNPDDILTAHPEWTDPTRLPTSSRESQAAVTAGKKQQDPLTKDGVVGLFNRVYYPIQKALETFLGDVYEPTASDQRWHLIESSSMAGVEIKEDKFVYSHHAKDPAYLKLCNAFDIVRIHRFGDLDDKASFKEMRKFAMSLDEVKMQAAEERLQEAGADFEDPADDDSWKARLVYEPRTLKLENSLHNIQLILENDPLLRDIVFNQLADGMEITGPVPWKHPAKFWRDQDDAQLISYVDSHYGSFSARNYEIAVTKVTDDRSYHPIREMFEALPPWDGVHRVDTLLIDYLGAQDNPYVRAVTRKALCAAYDRVFNPGIKYDYMIVLNGDQGIGKSTLIAKLGQEWFSDSLSLSDMNDKTAAEKLQGYWILEIGELAGMKKADIDKVKAFVSRQDDKYRASFGRRVTPHLRQCIFFGTTNTENGYLRDITGNRRFWNVKVTGNGKYQPWDLDTETIQMIWAEAMVLAKAGEPLYLPPELEAMAKEEQVLAMEHDEREGVVSEYLNMLLPENWDELNVYQRREFIRDTEDPTRPRGTVRRKVVSNIEIWCECFGKNKEDLRPSDSYAISAIMVRMRGWNKTSEREWLPIYGRQRVYKRDGE